MGSTTLDLAKSYMDLADVNHPNAILKDLVAKVTGFKSGAHLPKSVIVPSVGSAPIITYHCRDSQLSVHFPVVVDPYTNAQFSVTYTVVETATGLSVNTQFVF